MYNHPTAETTPGVLILRHTDGRYGLLQEVRSYPLSGGGEETHAHISLPSGDVEYGLATAFHVVDPDMRITAPDESGRYLVTSELLVEHLVGMADALDKAKEARDAASRALAEARVRHEADVETISTRFWEEARRREWCDEAEGFINGLNPSLNRPLSIPPNRYDVTVRVVVNLTVPITAADEDDATRLATQEEVDEWIKSTGDLTYWGQHLLDSNRVDDVTDVTFVERADD